VLAQSRPYDHCNLTVTDRAPHSSAKRFRDLLLSMSYADPQVRGLLDLEGLHEWRPGRSSAYGLLVDAVDAVGFYDVSGNVTAQEYNP
jgi:ABC-type phosphate/phosphonate transport system substrate-binding protein